MRRFAVGVVLTFVVVASYLQGYSDGKPDTLPPPPPDYSKKLDEQYQKGYSAGHQDGMNSRSEWKWDK